MNGISLDKINLQTTEILTYSELNLFAEIADRALNQMQRCLFAKAFGTEKKIIAISKGQLEERLSWLLSHADDTKHVQSIIEKIPLMELNLIVEWLEQDKRRCKRLLELEKKGQFPLILDLTDAEMTLTPFETLSLINESSIVDNLAKDCAQSRLYLGEINAKNVKLLLSCFRGKTNLDLADKELLYAISLLEIHSLHSIVLHLVLTRLNQAQNVDEIEAVIRSNPTTWHQIQKQQLGDVLQSKVRFCKNADEFERLLNISSRWLTCNMLEKDSEVMPLIELPKQADETWLKKLHSYIGGIDFSACKQIVLTHEAWEHLKGITHLEIQLPLYDYRKTQDFSDEPIKRTELLYAVSFCFALEHLVSLEKFNISQVDTAFYTLPNLCAEHKLVFFNVLERLPNIRSAYNSATNVWFPLCRFKDLTAWDFSGGLNLLTAVKHSPLMETMKIPSLDILLLEKLSTMSQLSDLDVDFHPGDLWDFHNWPLKRFRVSYRLPENHVKFVDQLSKIFSLVKLDLAFYSIQTEPNFAPLGNLKNLEELTLEGTSLSEEALQFISYLPALRSLSLKTIQRIGKFLGFIANKEKLEELEFTPSEDFDPEFLKELQGAVKLRKLHLVGKPGKENSRILDKDIEFLADKPIEDLCLVCLNLTNDAASTIKKITPLKKLKIQSNRITGEFLRAISGSLPFLNDLTYRGKPPSDEGWEALHNFPNLQRMDFANFHYNIMALNEILKMKTLRYIKPIVVRDYKQEDVAKIKAISTVLLERRIITERIYCTQV